MKNLKNKIENPTTTAKKKNITMSKDVFDGSLEYARTQGYQEGVDFSVQVYSGALAMCLVDKFSFTEEQLHQTIKEINNIFDSLLKGYVSFEDIKKTLKEEVNLNL